jgi:copper transport protein
VTRYGHLWLIRMTLWLALGVALNYGQRSRQLLWLALAIGMAILLTRSLYSHASVARDATAAIAGDWLHLAMVALWGGGLIQFFSVISHAPRKTSDDVTALSTLVIHFSNYARVAVAGLSISGLYAAWLQVGSVDALLTTLYGHTLLVKILLFLPLLAIAGINLVFTHRGLQQGRVEWGRRLRGLIGIEIALVIGVLAATGAMTSLNPARNVVAVRDMAVPAPPIQPFFQMQMVDDLHVHLAISPGTVGENTFTVDIYDMQDNHVTDASLIRLRFDNQNQNVGQSELRPTLQADGTYQATGANLSLPGTWRIRTTVQRPNQYDTVVDFEPQVTVPPPPPIPAPDMSSPLPDRTLAQLVTGLLALIIGGFFAGRSQARLWRGVGLLATTMLLVGVVFLVSGVMTL